VAEARARERDRTLAEARRRDRETRDLAAREREALTTPPVEISSPTAGTLP
jgi:hypothetical protein